MQGTFGLHFHPLTSELRIAELTQAKHENRHVQVLSKGTSQRSLSGIVMERTTSPVVFMNWHMEIVVNLVRLLLN
jgi:hypothetical protein